MAGKQQLAAALRRPEVTLAAAAAAAAAAPAAPKRLQHACHIPVAPTPSSMAVGGSMRARTVVRVASHQATTTEADPQQLAVQQTRNGAQASTAPAMQQQQQQQQQAVSASLQAAATTAAAASPVMYCRTLTLPAEVRLYACVRAEPEGQPRQPPPFLYKLAASMVPLLYQAANKTVCCLLLSCLCHSQVSLPAGLQALEAAASSKAQDLHGFASGVLRIEVGQCRPCSLPLRRAAFIAKCAYLETNVTGLCTGGVYYKALRAHACRPCT